MHFFTHSSRRFLTALLALSFIGLPLAPAFAAEPANGEIWYASISAIRGNTVVLDDKGPSGEQFFACDATSGACNMASGTPALPPINGSTTYLVNPQYTYALSQMAMPGSVLYAVYSLSNGTPQFVALVPYSTPTATVKFSGDGNTILFINGASVTTYAIDTKTLHTATLSQADLPFMSISYHGNYISAYDYVDKANRIWNLQTGALTQIPSTDPGYVEFSENEKAVAYLDRVGGFEKLFQAELNAASASAPQQVRTGNFTVEDYLYVGSSLFYVANADNVLEWSLYEVGANNTQTTVEESISYGDYIKRVPSSNGNKLGYLVIEGKEQNVNLYDPAAGKKTLLRPMEASPAPAESRTQTTIANRTGVILAPSASTKSKSGGNLFVWLHGGPQRDISLSYHSYLSYAVYDELLDRLVQAGNTVLKLDYTGSWGYGLDFQNALNGHIGVTDVADVLNAVAAMEKTHTYDHVYLIGNSYGGYLSLRTLTENPTEFDGAISINGVTDWYGLINRIPSSPFATLFNGVPDTNNLSLYLSASVYKSTANLTDQKVLLVYGTDDTEVPTWQTTDFYTFVKGQNKDVTLVTIPNEEHIIRARGSLDNLCSSVADTFDLSNMTCK